MFGRQTLNSNFPNLSTLLCMNLTWKSFKWPTDKRWWIAVNLLMEFASWDDRNANVVLTVVGGHLQNHITFFAMISKFILMQSSTKVEHFAKPKPDSGKWIYRWREKIEEESKVFWKGKKNLRKIVTNFGKISEKNWKWSSESKRFWIVNFHLA